MGTEASLHIYGFETSNNIKVRVALGYKAIPYRFRTIDPNDRSDVLRLSGQRLTPVLQHGEVVLFDSAAILRYLDANFRDTPTLFGAASDAEQWEIEDWELFARTQLAGPMLRVVHAKRTHGAVDEGLRARAATELEAAVAALAERLDGRRWLAGDRLTGADVTAAPVLRRLRTSGVLPLPAAADAPAVADWEQRVLAYDGAGRLP
jgi:glutathione S-transferase